MPRLRVLVSAYAFSPYRGSEHAVGWNVVTRLARHHDVTVLCGDVSARLGTRQELDRFARENSPIPGLTIHYVAPSKLITSIERLHAVPGFWAIYYLAYNLWQRRAYREAVMLHRQRPFHLAHQLNMIGYREPGYLWKLPIPFVWGPVGGAANEPLAFLPLFSWRGRFSVIARNAVNWLQKNFGRRPRKAARCAAKLWTVTGADHQMATRFWHAHAEPMIETGTAGQPNAPIHARQKRGPLCLVWSGLHEPRKALPIVLQAIAGLASLDRVRLIILGEGLETAAWKRMAAQLGVSGLIEWTGRLPRDQALTRMLEGHVCVFPSVKEGTPHVVLESLSLGLPVICHDACGMGIAVTDQCGIKVPLIAPSTSIAGFRQAIQRFLDEPELLSTLSAGALRRALELSWDRKAETLARAYEEVVAQSAPGETKHAGC